MFAPKWKKEAKLLDKAAKKFLNYKRDLLDEKQIAEIESRRVDLKKARKASDKEQVDEASKQLQATCENALPRYQAQGWFEENLEVFFVAIVVALGLRAYVVQPFRIPTASMQPTLNGYIAHYVEDESQLPAFPLKATQWATHGRTYVNITLDEDKVLRRENPIVQKNLFLHFFTRTYVHFEDGTSVSFPGPKAALMGYRGMGLGRKVLYQTNDMTPAERQEFSITVQQNKPTDLSFDIIGKNKQPYYNRLLPKGTIIARGYVESGDLILVDKMSYHFRKPKRGEVFVFDTRKIKGIQESARISGQPAGSHYIKRLAGVPGDKLELRNMQPDGSGELYINGKPAEEPGFKRVMAKKDGYGGYWVHGGLGTGQVLHPRDQKKPGKDEYIALGDNSFHSSDSRAWGSVKEFNVIGPASFSLWPFGSKHWGFIK